MQSGITLPAFAAKLKAQRAQKQDFIVDTAVAAMEIDADSGPRIFFDSEEAGPQSLPILPIAHGQIGDRIKLPAAYYKRMLAEAPQLLATNVNHWFKSNPEKRMIRGLDGSARAFLSNRYNRIENQEIAEVALPILSEIPDIKIIACEITERRMYIEAVAPRTQGEVVKGDVVQAGVVISNSEIGLGAASVAALDYRLWCLNGAIASEKFRAYHVGKHIEDDAALWADDTRQADDRAVLLKIRDMVASAVNEISFGRRLDKMRTLAGLKTTGNPGEAVKLLAQKVGATEDESSGILTALIEGGDLSAWGLMNAVTKQAHSATSFDRNVEFQAAGGMLLDMPAADWTRILEAA
jgi:hypothetical protein